MREIGILMSRPMCVALGAGRKTMTRRLCNLTIHSGFDSLFIWPSVKPMPHHQNCGLYARKNSTDIDETDGWLKFVGKSPYLIGDRLRFLSSWAVPAKFDSVKPLDLPKRVRMWTHFAGEKPKWAGKTRPGRFMPLALRKQLPSAIVKAVKVELAHQISEADALAEGFTPKTCTDVFDLACKVMATENEWWLECIEDGADGGSYCYRCAEKELKKLGKEWEIRGGSPCARESDGPAYCDECHKPLLMSLTEYGVERELRIEDDPDGKEPQYWPCRGTDAAIVRQLACGIGDLQEKHHGRLAQIGFATLWNVLHGAESWQRNDWVWAVSFKMEAAHA